MSNKSFTDVAVDAIAEYVVRAAAASAGVAAMHATITYRDKVDYVALAAGISVSVGTYLAGTALKNWLLD